MSGVFRRANVENNITPRQWGEKGSGEMRNNDENSEMSCGEFRGVVEEEMNRARTEIYCLCFLVLCLTK